MSHLLRCYSETAKMKLVNKMAYNRGCGFEGLLLRCMPGSNCRCIVSLDAAQPVSQCKYEVLTGV